MGVINFIADSGATRAQKLEWTKYSNAVARAHNEVLGHSPSGIWKQSPWSGVVGEAPETGNILQI